MKRGSTLFLKLAVFLIGVPILSLCIISFIWLINHPVSPDYSHILYPIVIGMYISVIPFFVALYLAFKLLNYIDRGEAFSEISVKALKNIKFCALSVSGLYVVMIPFVYMIAELDDAPVLIFVGLVPIFASMVIAVFVAVLQRLLQEAIDIKLENDLTV